MQTNAFLYLVLVEQKEFPYALQTEAIEKDSYGVVRETGG